ncbi:MAG: hypothetical protein JW751_21700 [Polyangiaceae bacterium]|nr:hypothetical protein [Polyangiaceae bacterium]
MDLDGEDRDELVPVLSTPEGLRLDPDGEPLSIDDLGLIHGVGYLAKDGERSIGQM